MTLIPLYLTGALACWLWLITRPTVASWVPELTAQENVGLALGWPLTVMAVVVVKSLQFRK